MSRNPDLVTTDKTVNEIVDETVNKKKLARGERIKRALRKVVRARGGEGVQYVGRVANFIENNLDVLASIIQLLFERIPSDLSVSMYDLYYRTGVIQNEPEFVCGEPGSPFVYLLIIFRRSKKNL